MTEQREIIGRIMAHLDEREHQMENREKQMDKQQVIITLVTAGLVGFALGVCYLANQIAMMVAERSAG